MCGGVCTREQFSIHLPQVNKQKVSVYNVYWKEIINRNIITLNNLSHRKPECNNYLVVFVLLLCGASVIFWVLFYFFDSHFNFFIWFWC